MAKLTKSELEMLGFATENENKKSVVNTNNSYEVPSHHEAPARPSFAAVPRRVVILTDELVGTFVKVGNEIGMIDGFYPNIGRYGFVTSNEKDQSWAGRLVNREKIEPLKDIAAAKRAAKQYYDWEAEHLQNRMAMNSGNITKLVDLLSEVAYWQERLA